MIRRVAVIGMTVTSNRGNGHAATFRGLLSALARRGHEVSFIERDDSPFAKHRDMPQPGFCDLVTYRSPEELRELNPIRDADFVIVGSSVPDGAAVGEWVLSNRPGLAAFYDIDAPTTAQALDAGTCAYLDPQQIPRYDAFFSLSGGPGLGQIARRYGATRALPLYGSVDPTLYFPSDRDQDIDLGHLSTSADLDHPMRDPLMLDAARKWAGGSFLVAGPRDPEEAAWPSNVAHVEELSPSEHRDFYNRQCFTLNLSRGAWTPRIRMFEAAACGVPIISDPWDGIEEFFIPDWEILVARSAEETLHYLRDVPEWERLEMADRARAHVLAEHTAARRAEELEGHMEWLLSRRAVTLR